MPTLLLLLLIFLPENFGFIVGGCFCWVYTFRCNGNSNNTLYWIELWEGKIGEQRKGGFQGLEVMRLLRRLMNPIQFPVLPSIFSHPFIRDSIMRLVSIDIFLCYWFFVLFSWTIWGFLFSVCLMGILGPELQRKRLQGELVGQEQ